LFIKKKKKKQNSICFFFLFLSIDDSSVSEGTSQGIESKDIRLPVLVGESRRSPRANAKEVELERRLNS